MKKGVFLVLGWLCVGLGFVGIFLPLLPTTPFLLLALFLFTHSSPRLRIMLMRHRLMGSYIRGYASERGLSVRSKVTTIVVMWVTMLFSVIFVVEEWFVRVLLLFIGLAVSIHILLKRTYRPDE